MEEELQWALPTFNDATQLKYNDDRKEKEEIRKEATREFTDVKFYPYTKLSDNPIFAVVNARQVLICRPCAETSKKGYDVIQAILDTDPECKIYCCAWTKDTAGTPLLLTAGANATIRIYDVLRGRLTRTIVGLGGTVNDLAISPINPDLLASACGDDRLSIWSLHPENAHQPCMAIMAGIGGHRESLLSVSFHDNGQYVVSGSEDRVVKIWRMPESFHPRPEKTRIIQYPLFSTSAIHSGHVECVKFCGDLILSKAFEEGCIVLWKVEGFSSSSPPPSIKAHSLERTLASTFSCFAPDQILDPDGSSRPCAQYTRLMQFAIPGCECLYMRFGLYLPRVSSKFTHPILSFSNSDSKVFFWDFARFNAYAEYIDAVLPHATSSAEAASFLSDLDAMDLDNSAGFDFSSNSKPKPSWLQIARLPKKLVKAKSSLLPQLQSLPTNLTSVSRGTSPASLQTGSSSTEQALLDACTVFSKEDLERSRKGWDEMYSIRDRWKKLKAHKTLTVPTYKFTGRQVAWSDSGEWCVVSGSENIIVVLRR